MSSSSPDSWVTGLLYPKSFVCVWICNTYQAAGNFERLKCTIPSRRCLHFEAVGGLEWSNDPESYAGGSVATGRASLAGKVKDDDPD